MGQGFNISPLVFNLYLDEAAVKLKGKVQKLFKIGGEIANTVRFTDKMAAIFEPKMYNVT